MNIEDNRLQTFSDWPSDAVVNPARIAKAGFYSLKQNLTVQCFSCGVRITDWEYGDQVMARHRRLSPECPFVIDPSTSGNVPKIQVTSSLATQSPDLTLVSESLKEESVRLRTFENWPAQDVIQPQQLARAGFYSLKDGDKTKCAFCSGVVGSWEVGDDPDKEHKRHFPHCSFVLSVIDSRLENLNINPTNGTNLERRVINATNYALVQQDNLQHLGVNTHAAPKKPSFATYESRVRSFTAWPEDLIQTPDVMAQAGFYYEGCGDHVRCFHCDGGLRHWDPDDDPWTEHARWFPRCAFVQLVKGQEFISACAIEDNIENDEVYRRSNRKENLQHLEHEIRTNMGKTPAMTALGIGLSYGRVKQAIREKLLTTGRGFRNADTLIEAALNIQHEEEAEDSDNDHDSRRMLDTLNALVENVLSENSERKGSKSEVAEKNIENKTPESVSSNSSQKLSLEEENRLLKEARLCKICMDNEVGIVFLPCGHLATCVTCAPNLQDCPVCRSSIKATVRTFLS